MYEMKPEYFTGIELVDSEHKRLFELAEQAYQLLKAEYIPDKYDHVKDLLIELREYTEKHFADEEEYMESIQYKRITSQRLQHRNFIKKLSEVDVDEVIDEDPEKAIEEILNFLTKWLVHHIFEMDMMIGKD